MHRHARRRSRSWSRLAAAALCMALGPVGWVLAGCVAHAPTSPSPPLVTAAPLARPSVEPWWKGAVFYEIFVRSFADSDGDGVGDLAGLIERLDELNDGDPRTTGDLGVEALWLMPVFESPSYHGYDTVDYEAIERDYGTNADFERLLHEAHRRGMRVIVDLVLNHTSDQHPWFIESARDASSPRRDWYVWRDRNPGWGQPWSPGTQTWHQRANAWYYGLFWSGMPDLNFRTPAVRQELTRLAVKWARAGVDGFRLDAVRHLVETGPGAGQAGSDENHEYLRALAAAVRAANPQAVLVGEVWSTTDDIARYFGRGDELDLLFDFPLADALVKSAWSGEARPIVETLEAMAAKYPPGAVSAPFLTNHDQPRVATALGRDARRLRLAAALLLTMPGTPFIYYGEELGLANGPGVDDTWKRTPMPWSDGPGLGFTTGTPWQATSPAQLPVPFSSQRSDPSSLLARYRALVRARASSPALALGSLELLSSAGQVLAFTRTLVGSPTEQVLVVHNLSGARAEVWVEGLGARDARGLFVDRDVEVTPGPSGWSVRLPPYASGIFRLEGGGPAGSSARGAVMLMQPRRW